MKKVIGLGVMGLLLLLGFVLANAEKAGAEPTERHKDSGFICHFTGNRHGVQAPAEATRSSTGSVAGQVTPGT